MAIASSPAGLVLAGSVFMVILELCMCRLMNNEYHTLLNFEPQCVSLHHVVHVCVHYSHTCAAALSVLILCHCHSS